MRERIKELIETLKHSIPFVEHRGVSSTGDRFEAVLLRQDLQRCSRLLEEAFGEPVKAFGAAVNLDREIEKAITPLGGIRAEQCLFFVKGNDAAQPAAYAALWPWASNAERVTLKVGLVDVP